MVVVRPAELSDAEEIAALVEIHSRRGEVLPRSFEAVTATIGDWLVAVKNEKVLGCGSIRPYTPTLSEIRSLVVLDHDKGKGIGTALLDALIAKAKREEIHTLFALTRVVPFFERAGFSLTDPALFPEKIWQDCLMCPILDKCDEHAVVLYLKSHTETGAFLSATYKEGAINDNHEG